VILILLLMIASLVLVFLGLATDITIRTQGTSLLTHMVLTYAGLLVTLLSHMAAFLYIIGLRKLLLTPPPDEDSEEANIPTD
jgi:membrane protein implicated in regulation of membrane protease activity